jgi:hypothetical protein
VDERLLPRVAVVGGRGDVDLDARLVERDARERHVVLPADQPADAAETGLDRLEPAAVALAPDEPLVVVGTSLRWWSASSPRRVVEERVVDRPGRSASTSLTPVTIQMPSSSLPPRCALGR